MLLNGAGQLPYWRLPLPIRLCIQSVRPVGGSRPLPYLVLYYKYKYLVRHTPGASLPTLGSYTSNIWANIWGDHRFHPGLTLSAFAGCPCNARRLAKIFSLYSKGRESRGRAARYSRKVSPCPAVQQPTCEAAYMYYTFL